VGLAKDAPHGPSAQCLDPDKVNEIVETTDQTPPPGATYWSTRKMAEKFGVSRSSVARIWDAHGLQPRQTKAFKLIQDNPFVENLKDVVGLYMNPPEKALVLCVNGKSRVQAIWWSKQGEDQTKTPNDKWEEFKSLFIAINSLEGTVVGTCYPFHRDEEFLKFLRRIYHEAPRPLALHLILTNYGTQNHPKVKEWLEHHRRFRLHLASDLSPWEEVAKQWFHVMFKKIHPSCFEHVPELVNAIGEYIRLNNQNHRSFVWTKKVEDGGRV
jgi:hypothetical protein